MPHVNPRLRQSAHLGIGGTLAGNALTVAAMRAVLEEVLTSDNYRGDDRGRHAISRTGARAVIVANALPWHVTQIGARAEIMFMPRPPLNGAEVVAGRQPDLETLLHAFYMNEGVLVTPFHTMFLMCPATSDCRCRPSQRDLRGFVGAVARGRGRSANERRVPFDLTGRVALVTGGGRGIGAAIVTRLAEAGATSSTANRTRDVVDALARRAVHARSEGAGRPLSTGSTATRCAPGRRYRPQCRPARHPRPQRRRLSLGLGRGARRGEAGRTLDVNLKASFWLAQAAVPHMRKNRFGRILVTSSVSARVAMGGGAHYSAAKAGVNAFIRGAAFEFARDGITVNGVEAGFHRQGRAAP